MITIDDAVAAECFIARSNIEGNDRDAEPYRLKMRRFGARLRRIGLLEVHANL